MTIQVALGSEELEEAKQRALSRLARTVKVDGFRKGKVPLNVAEKHLDPNALADEAINYAINKVLDDIVTLEKLRVLDQPKIELKKLVPYTELSFEAIIEIVPDITLGNYKNLKVKKTTSQVEDKEVDDVITRLMTNSASRKEVKRAAQNDDEVTIDFIGKKDGEAFDGGTATDHVLTLGSKTFIPGFEEAIVSHAVGEQFAIPLKFPKDYHAKELAGKAVVFDVTLKKVSEVVKPALDDAFAAKIGPFTSVQELNDDIRRELLAQKEREASDKYNDDLVGALVDASKIPVPAILVDDQMRSIGQDARQNLLYRGMSVEDYLSSQGYADEEEWAEKEFRDAAVRRVKAGLALAELSKLENIEVTKDELDARLAEMLQQYPTMKEQLEAPEARADIVNRLVTEKTLVRLTELNK